MLESGLYLVSTPIGNMEDITLRAIRVLKEVDVIASEDTRRSGLLLKKYNIEKPLLSYHDHNKMERTPQIIKRIKGGESFALISDSGTPGISDPGFYLVKEAIKEGIPVVPIPGPTALISGLIVSGLPTDRFAFEGFLPRRKGRRRKRLQQLVNEERTMIFFEAPHRLLYFLQDLQEILGNRRIAVLRELTKKFEDTERGLVSEFINTYKQKKPKGEFVIVVEGKKSYANKD
ncbi:MAG TPA: 16S rRNA (cytidine(1402)-2'-O)-methyltransferase [bacterium (Candidatus Stahlbacteria)]|nr:16S rRNA (cytidine(1402)-2'-O)-methyltransferase [Candidatus Stahlbacteria bacterium]